MSTMKAARLHAAGPHPTADLRIEHVPVPEPGPGQVLLRVEACGVCASDLHVVEGVTPNAGLPMSLGHEIAGVVEAAGDDVEGWLAGDRVCVLAGLPCDTCDYCRAGRYNLCSFLRVPGVTADGGQSEYFLSDARFLAPVPSSIPAEHAAILTDAVATSYHALKRGGVGEGVSAAIFGLGGLGMHTLLLAKMAGCDPVIGVDIDPVNLERATEWGADAVIDASDGKPAKAIRQMTGLGVDRTFEFVGSPAVVDQAFKALKPGGRATVVGLTGEALTLASQALLVAPERELVGSFGSTPQDLNELVDLCEAGRLDLSRSISHRFSIEEFPRALDLLRTRDEHPIRMVVTY